MMGCEPNGLGATVNQPGGATGNISHFEHWLTMNHYSLSYVQGTYAAIHDEHYHIVGVANAADAGFQEIHYPAPPPLLPALGQALSEIGHDLSQQFQSSSQVPWDQLHGDEFWNAASNPHEYLQNHPQH